jgi:hypothetical protein
VRIAVEDALRIDLASPAMREATKPGARSGSWTWSHGGERIASIGYELGATCDDRRTLMLIYTASGVPARQAISLVRSRPRYGGWRWWFLCPVLLERGERRPVRAIFLPPGQRYFGSRTAYGLNYRSQKESRSLPRLIERLLRD